MDWIEKIPKHWQVTRLDRLFSLRKEQPMPEDERVTAYLSGRVTLRTNVKQKIKGVIKDSGWQRIYPGDFAISGMNAHMGGMGVSDSLGKCSPIYLILTPHNSIDAHFISHVVRYIARIGVLKSLVNTIRYNSADFKRKHLKLIPVWLPPFDEQIEITKFLKTLEEKINYFNSVKHRLIKLLNEHKNAVIQKAVIKGLNPNVNFKQSQIEFLGDIPEHWEIIPNRFLYKETVRNYNGGNFVHLSVSQRDGLVPNDKLKERTLKTASYENFKICLPNELILNRFKAHLGVFFASNQTGIVTFHYGVFSPLKKIKSKYFELLYHTEPYKAIYGGLSNGMTIGLQNLSNQNFYKVHSIVPPLNEQIDIIDYVRAKSSAVSQRVSNIQREIKLMNEYRDRLMADVITGHLNVQGVKMFDLK